MSVQAQFLMLYSSMFFTIILPGVNILYDRYIELYFISYPTVSYYIFGLSFLSQFLLYYSVYKLGYQLIFQYTS